MEIAKEVSERSVAESVAQLEGEEFPEGGSRRRSNYRLTVFAIQLAELRDTREVGRTMLVSRDRERAKRARETTEPEESRCSYTDDEVKQGPKFCHSALSV